MPQWEDEENESSPVAVFSVISPRQRRAVGVRPVNANVPLRSALTAEEQKTVCSRVLFVRSPSRRSSISCASSPPPIIHREADCETPPYVIAGGVATRETPPAVPPTLHNSAKHMLGNTGGDVASSASVTRPSRSACFEPDDNATMLDWDMDNSSTTQELPSCCHPSLPPPSRSPVGISAIGGEMGSPTIARSVPRRRVVPVLSAPNSLVIDDMMDRCAAAADVYEGSHQGNWRTADNQDAASVTIAVDDKKTEVVPMRGSVLVATRFRRIVAGTVLATVVIGACLIGLIVGGVLFG